MRSTPGGPQTPPGDGVQAFFPGFGRAAYLFRSLTLPAGPVPLGQLHRIDALARHLPFALDDYAEAGRAFARWRASGTAEDRHVVELWTYCYAHRYFSIRFSRERTAGASDVDEVIGRAYGRILRHLGDVRQPLKYAHFVSVVCKRALLNYRARRRETVEVDEATTPPTPPAEANDYDRQLVRAVLAEAIEGLPPAGREVARRRILEGLGYEAIAEATGHPTPTVRTYVSKALARLRTHPTLRALYYDDVLPPGLNGEQDPRAQDR